MSHRLPPRTMRLACAFLGGLPAVQVRLPARPLGLEQLALGRGALGADLDGRRLDALAGHADRVPALAHVDLERRRARGVDRRAPLSQPRAVTADLVGLER